MKQNRDTRIGERAKAFVSARAAADAAKRSRKNKTMSSDSSTGGSDTVPATPERDEFRKEMMRRNATPGMKKGGEMKKYAAGGVTKEMPSSKAMGSLNMAKGGKVKSGMADKAGRALVKKSADTMGRAMVGAGKSSSPVGVAKKGHTGLSLRADKTKPSMAKFKKGGKTC